MVALKTAIKRFLALLGYEIHRTGRAVHDAPLVLVESKCDLRPAAIEHRDPVIMREFGRLPMSTTSHAAQAFATDVLEEIESMLPREICHSAETGCGKSTILFSNVSKHHRVFTLDDTDAEGSSVTYFRDCPMTKLDRIEMIFGPTQETLPMYKGHASYDLVLLDGPHGYPFPELEYFFFYPHIKPGGLLIVDDVCIPTIGRLADFLAEDEMFTLEHVVGATAVFRRTAGSTFNPLGDGWWQQRYNRRRVSKKRDIYLPHSNLQEVVTSMSIDEVIHGG